MSLEFAAMAQLQNPESLAQEVQREFDQLRSANGVRELTEDESGTGVDRLPGGVYGFTYSACEDNFPLFRARDLRSFETHKLADGTVLLLGFLTPEDKKLFDDTTRRGTLHLLPEPKDSATLLVSLDTKRVSSHVENSARSGQGLEVTIGPAN